jgi:hypothetical protein
MKKALILVVCTLLLALFPWTMESAAQEPRVFYLPIVIAPSQLNQMERHCFCSGWGRSL